MFLQMLRALSFVLLLQHSAALVAAPRGLLSPSSGACAPAASRAAFLRMDEPPPPGSSEVKAAGSDAAAAIERMQQRAKSYNREKKGPSINPNTYNVLYGAIIAFTLNDLRQNADVLQWLSGGAALDAVPFSALGASTLLMAYALFQLAFSFGTGTSTPFRQAVLKLGVTEPPFSSALNDEKRRGEYRCASCDVTLFDSEAKYDSGSGWPAFWRTNDGGVEYSKEFGGRMEVKCAKCSGHLGHVFSDGPDVQLDDVVPDTDPGGTAAAFAMNDETVHPRFCINGAALSFVPDEVGGGAVGTLPKEESRA